jgi:glycosyltransferase involved in cell wall biosynthesis
MYFAVFLPNRGCCFLVASPELLNDGTVIDKQELRILIVSPFGDTYGGSQQCILHLLNGLDKSRFRPIIVVPDQGTLYEHLTRSGVEVHCIPANYLWFPESRKYYRTLEGMRERLDAFVKFIQDKKIDVVHTNGIWAIEGAMAARLTGVPHVLHVHCLFSNRHPIFEYFPLSTYSYGQLINEFSDHVVGVSDACVNTLTPYVPSKRLSRIYNGIPLDRIISKGAETAAFKQTEGIPSDAIVVTSVGRISRVKGYHTFVKAAVRVLKNHQIHFLLIGPEEDPPLAQELKKIAAAIGIAARFQFLGGRNNVAQLLAASDIFVSTSLQEAHPLTCIEAMAAGLPVVATRSGGTEEVVSDGETGFLVPVGDDEAVAQALVKLISDAELRERMGHAGMERARIFDMLPFITQWEEMYVRLHSQREKRCRDSLSVDISVNMLSELGRMGGKLHELEWRTQQLENFMGSFKSNLMFRYTRRMINGIRRLLGQKDS